MDIKTVLVATDFSKKADFAIERAIQIAKRFNAKLIVMHSLQNKILDDFFGNIFTGLLSGNFWPTVTERKEKHLKKIVSNLSKIHNITIDTYFTTQGKPAVEILNYIIKNNIDFLVIGGHGKYSIRESYIGTTAEYISEFTTCPVLIVKQSLKKEYQNILFPIDFSETSKKAFFYGYNLFSNTPFNLLNVIDNEYEEFLKGENESNIEIKNQVEELREQILLITVKKMEEFIQFYPKPIAKECYQIMFNNPGPTITKEACNLSCDLIVMGTQGNTINRYLKVGSVANYTLKESNKDILLVPASL